jgi:adenylate cyclase
MENVKRVILFCDIREFGRLARALGDALPAFVQGFYEMVGAAVVSQGGKLIKYIGDSVLAIFPEGTEEAAVRSGLRMRAAYPTLAGGRAAGIRSDLSVSIGSGVVAFGIIGHASLRTEDVFGETVNETAMIAHSADLVVSRSVRDALAVRDSLGARVLMEPLPDVQLKWRTEPVQAWRVIEQA